MKFTVQSSDDTSAPPRTGRRQSRSLHCNTPALVGAPANSRTATELGSVAFTGHTNGGALGIVLGGTTPSLFTLATRWGCRRNRARFRHGFTTPAHIGAPAEPRTATEDCTRWRSSGDCPQRLEEPPRAQRKQLGCTSKSTQKATLETGEKSLSRLARHVRLYDTVRGEHEQPTSVKR